MKLDNKYYGKFKKLNRNQKHAVINALKKYNVDVLPIIGKNSSIRGIYVAAGYLSKAKELSDENRKVAESLIKKLHEKRKDGNFWTEFDIETIFDIFLFGESEAAFALTENYGTLYLDYLRLFAIRKAIRSGFKVSDVLLINEDGYWYDGWQMKLFVDGLEHGIKPEEYMFKHRSGRYPDEKILRLLIEAKIENRNLDCKKLIDALSDFNSKVSVCVLESFINYGEDVGFKLLNYVDNKLFHGDINLLAKDIFYGIDVTKYLIKGKNGEYLSYDVMKEVSRLLNEGIDPSDFLNKDYDNDQLRVIFDGLGEGLDVSKFCGRLRDGSYFSGDQMREILIAMRNGFNLHKYKRLQKGGKYMSWEDMEKLNEKNILHKDLSKFSDYFSKKKD